MNIPRLRLANQQIARPKFDDPAALVRWMGAVQAQDYLGGLWAVGLRTRGATEASVEAAITRREFVRTWPMRGTLHFVAAEDVRWMSRLLTPRVITATASRYRQLELDGQTFARAARVTEKALAGGQCVRRGRLYEHWASAGVATRDSRGLHILGHLAQTGLICFGPRDGKQHTFTLLEEWLPAARSLERDEALGELARRYFRSHGPATVHDLAWWSGLTVTDVRAAIELAKADLESEDVDGRTYWFAPGIPSRATNDAHLLPAWDEYTVGYRDREAVIDPAHVKKVNAGGGVLNPVVVLRGHVIGTWRRTLGKSGATITPSFFGRSDQEAVGALADAAERYARFLGAQATVQRARGAAPRRPAS